MNSEINDFDKESERLTGLPLSGLPKDNHQALQAQSQTHEVALKKLVAPHSQPWHQDIRSRVSKEVVHSITDYASHRDFEKKLFEDFEQLIQSGAHTSSFVHQTITEDSLLTMQGIAIIAAYLKQKHQLENLHVCKSLEALQNKLIEIRDLPGNSRHAVIIAYYYEEEDYQDEQSSEYVSDPRHKLTICVEKTGSSIKVAILDALGEEKELLSPKTVFAPAADLKNTRIVDFEAILWYVCRSLKPENTAVYFPPMGRQKVGFGCETFALKDALFFLRNPKFFEQIEAKEVECIERQADGKVFTIRLQEIQSLPPVFMKGTQDAEMLEDYYQKHLQTQEAEKLQLQRHVEQHTVKNESYAANYYINQQSFKYHLFVLEALKALKEEELQQIIKTVFLRAYRPEVNPPFPVTLSDLHRWKNIIEFKYSEAGPTSKPWY